ncbi:unnamed protein product [Commensalibacter communis]|uniref:DUF4145 domain-containing protein n=1 Tax=Commensalibacter communis TaxID=2972786 RepID=A0A9W4TQW5_9PROT|nr:DUF4145 domain-containing protein [Commensalibacter communis]CAI3950104.1 unnamed protein product [Commensalibacter communis]CAI3952966.1 unnamed protein product [Commensalibacter communis]CAI3954165.1 unnamed protein product [Commensalibacter communis]CAI3955578.1 unnamed protein product [Commensalibacter communis]
MSQVVHDCPYCKSKNMTFDIIVNSYDQEYQQAYGRKYDSSVIEPDPEALFYSMTVRYYALGQCRKSECQQTVPFVLECQASEINIIDILRPPMNSPYLCPKHTPKNIEKIFDEAAQCYAAHCFTASLTMLRTCLDMTTKDLLNEESDQKKSLYQRIEILFNKGFIRLRLKEFAEEIRVEGNNAVHDGDTSPENLKAVFYFVTSFLREVYSDEKEMSLIRERRAQRKNQGKTS